MGEHSAYRRVLAGPHCGQRVLQQLECHCCCDGWETCAYLRISSNHVQPQEPGHPVQCYRQESHQRRRSIMCRRLHKHLSSLLLSIQVTASTGSRSSCKGVTSWLRLETASLTSKRYMTSWTNATTLKAHRPPVANSLLLHCHVFAVPGRCRALHRN